MPPAARAADESKPLALAEGVAAGWELFSALLFVSAIVPAAFDTPWPLVVFGGSLALSAALSRRLIRAGPRGILAAAAIRVVTWPIAVLPLLSATGPLVLVAAVAFGFMAGGMRRAAYGRLIDDPFAADEGDVAADGERGRSLSKALRSRLGESAMVAGIMGGHAMLLFSVAFLRTRSQVIFEGWRDLVPVLAVLGTLGFTLGLRPLTRQVVAALARGPEAKRPFLMQGLLQAQALPTRLAALNFALWFACTTIGVFYFRTGPTEWSPGDAVMQLAFGWLFAWGVSFYQRAWHRDAAAPAVAMLRTWTGSSAVVEEITLRRRMLRDFGLPLLFTAFLSLLSSIGLYRALASEPSFREDFDAIGALFASFAILVIAVGGVVARAARELSRPMTQLARAADLVARGELDAAVPAVQGPVEVVALGESVERMRQALAKTIDELSRERAGLEVNVENRTAELRRALEELKQAQAALVHGERMASIGELVAGVAHEIYNPLNAIAGSAEPMDGLVADVRAVFDAYREAEALLPEPKRRALAELRKSREIDIALDDLVGISAVVRRATHRSVGIVTNLKNFSRAAGEAAPADLHLGIDETLMLLESRLRHAGIEVDKTFGDLPEVRCRAGEMNQVFMNLLTNAIHALESPEGEGPARRRTIRIETSRDEGDAVIAISDSGPGVAEALARRVFDPFFTTKPRGLGTGLGLSISTDIVRRHGGALLLERPAAGGARFVCRIPIEGAATAPVDSRPPREPVA